MPKRISAGSFEYAGKSFKAGDPVEVEAAHVPLLLHIGNIKPERGEPGFVEKATHNGGEDATVPPAGLRKGRGAPRVTR